MCRFGHKWKKWLSTALAVVFLAFGVACKDEQTSAGDITVYMPDGAPALAMAKLMHEDSADDGVSYAVVDPQVIQLQVGYTDASKNADLCVLPVNAAAKLLGNGENYQMLGAVTRGNLYLLGREDAAITQENISSLLGKKVGVLQLNQVPGLTFKATLQTLGVAYHELVQGATMQDNAVNLYALTGASDIDLESDTDYWLIAEPAASLQMKQKSLCRVGDLQALYGGGYTQAVLVAKKSIITGKAEWLKGFLADLKANTEWIREAEANTIVSAVTAHLADKNYASTLKAPMLSQEAISHCGLGFVSAKDCAVDTTAFLGKMIAINPNATVLPSADFYCTTDFGV